MSTKEYIERCRIMKNKIIKFLKNPKLLFLSLGQRGFFNWMDDEKYLKIAYKIKTGGG